MGYDLHWKEVPDYEELDVKLWRDRCDEAVKLRNSFPEEEKGTSIPWGQLDDGVDIFSNEAYTGRSERYAAAHAQVLEASAQKYQAQESYFRANIGGMDMLRNFMFEHGMAFEDVEFPPWPEYEDFGITEDQYYVYDDPGYYSPERGYPPLTEDQIAACEKYKEATDEFYRFHGKTDVPGIPLHKLCSNDSWHVLPVECRAAVEIWRNAGKPEPEKYKEFWMSWIVYLEGAARHGGFVTG